MRNDLSRLQLALYASPAIAVSALGFPLMIFLPHFYAETIGLGVETVGFVFMLTRIWDMCVDPVFGLLIDRTKQKGRFNGRKLLMAAALPLILLSVYFIFNPPKQATSMYLLAWMLALYSGWTLLTISHLAWGAELETEYDRRSRIMGWREFCLGLGMFLMLIVPAIMELVFHVDESTKIAFMGWFILGTLPATVVAALLKVPAPHIPSDLKQAKIDATLWRIVRSEVFVRVFSASALVGFGTGVTTSLYIFFVSRILGRPELTSILLLVYFLVAFLGIPAWLKMSFHLGKHKTLSVGMIYWAIVLVLPLFVEKGSVILFSVYVVLFSLADGASNFLFRSIVADITDKDLLDNGTQRTGLLFALTTMSPKAGGALAVGISYPLLGYFGFSATDPSAGGLDALRWVYVGLSAPAFILAGLIMWRYPLNKKQHSEMRSALVGNKGTAN
jgi:GPH family glycoside/pentoside/hexuronide:cation symporter